MGYSSVNNRRPFEAASKSSHHHIINDPEVQDFLSRISKVPRSAEVTSMPQVIRHERSENNPIEAIVAVDGGYTETLIEKEFPSRVLHFLQFGALLFKRDDLVTLGRSAFIAPEDMSKLKNINRLKLVLPTKNIRFRDETTLRGSVLRAIYEFYSNNNLQESQSLIDTLAWLIFRRYKTDRSQDEKQWLLSTNPLAPESGSILLKESDMEGDYSFKCPVTGGKIFLTDIFRLHEVIDEESGAAGILGYLVNVIEHTIIIHIIRQLLRQRPATLNKVLFIKDGPTGFFGQTARLHVLMRDLVGWLFTHQNLLLTGLEKSGAFVDHANEISNKLQPGSALLLDNEYIYRYILPGQADPSRAYGSTTNYGHKLIFKTRAGQIYVVSVPSKDVVATPTQNDLPNLQLLLTNVEDLHCDMYDSALFPVALVNKLVSLSAHPSQRILQQFAIASLQ